MNQTLTKTQTHRPLFKLKDAETAVTGLPAGPVAENCLPVHGPHLQSPGQGAETPQDTELLSQHSAGYGSSASREPCATIHVWQRSKDSPRASTKTQSSQKQHIFLKKSKEEGRRLKRGLRREEEVTESGSGFWRMQGGAPWRSTA